YESDGRDEAEELDVRVKQSPHPAEVTHEDAERHADSDTQPPTDEDASTRRQDRGSQRAVVEQFEESVPGLERRWQEQRRDPQAHQLPDRKSGHDRDHRA